MIFGRLRQKSNFRAFEHLLHTAAPKTQLPYLFIAFSVNLSCGIVHPRDVLCKTWCFAEGDTLKKQTMRANRDKKSTRIRKKATCGKDAHDI
jgi:hypothetical protein